MSHIALSIDDERWRHVSGLEPALTEAAGAALTAGNEALAAMDSDISISLASDAALRELNRDYRGKDTPTNVLSFPGFDSEQDLAGAMAGARAGGPPLMLGDLILAYETVAREAEAQGKPFLNHARHLVVHGVLHLIGFDHESDAEAEIMEAAERRILSGLGVPDPYLNEHPIADIVEDAS